MKVHLEIEVDVVDTELLRKYAEERTTEAFGLKCPTLVADQVIEALVLSNENPAPLDYGIEIVDWRTTTVVALGATPFSTPSKERGPKGIIKNGSRKNRFGKIKSLPKEEP